MPGMDGLSNSPHISEMFQKFALACKTKTLELFTEDDETATTIAAAVTDTEDTNGFALLDSAEEFITDQKVVVIKPYPTHNLSAPNSASPIPPSNTQLTKTLTSSLFATISSFEASYLQLQTAQVPFDEHTIIVLDGALVSFLQRLSDVRQLYSNFRRNPCFNFDYPIGSCLEDQVQENQSKLRALETLFNRLQSDIDVKDGEVSVLRKKLLDIQQSNSKLSKRLSKSLKSNSPTEVLFSIRVFDSMLRDACRSLHCFTKLLIDLMKKAGWDLDLAANSIHPDIEYAKKRHNRHAFLSYVCLGMFRGFDSETFGSSGSETVCNGDSLSKAKNNSLMQLIEHVSGNPFEVLSRNPGCDFSRFCESKYEQLIHPAMESSIFGNLDQKVVVLEPWRSLGVFYQLFVKMSSSIWFLHKLAYSFNPVIEIFQVERGVGFSMVYMEDVIGRGTLQGKSRPKVGFTVVPGFKIGRTVIQSRVYLTD